MTIFSSDTVSLAASPKNADNRHHRANHSFTRTRNGSEKVAYQLGLKEEDNSKKKKEDEGEKEAHPATPHKHVGVRV